MPDEQEELWFQGDDTLKKVYRGLLEAGIFGQQAVEVVDAIEKQGIFFRERKPKRRGRPPKLQAESLSVSQTVNEPKALSSAEIYRQTAAQIAPAGKVIEATEKKTDPWEPNDAEKDGLNGN